MGGLCLVELVPQQNNNDEMHAEETEVEQHQIDSLRL